MRSQLDGDTNDDTCGFFSQRAVQQVNICTLLPHTPGTHARYGLRALHVVPSGWRPGAADISQHAQVLEWVPGWAVGEAVFNCLRSIFFSLRQQSAPSITMWAGRVGRTAAVPFWNAWAIASYIA